MEEHAPTPSGKLVITDVQTQRRRAIRRSIFINGEFAFGISEENYVRYALFRGREVTKKFLAEVRRNEDLYQARQIAMRFLGQRLRSVQEVERKLQEREFGPDVISATIAFLREYRMLDDDAFARAYVNDQLLRRPVGRRRLQNDLRRLGVSDEMAEQALDGSVAPEIEYRNALKAARKRLSTLRQEDPRKRDRTLQNFLATRGFGWGAISRVLERVRTGTMHEDEEEQ